MRALVDSHALLWFLEGSERISDRARGFIEDSGNEILVSAAALWEIAIKFSLGKLELTKPFDEVFPDQLEANALGVLSVDVSHIMKVATLPFHHRDPFDRLMISQALVEGIPVVGVDPNFDAYGVDRIW